MAADYTQALRHLARFHVKVTDCTVASGRRHCPIRLAAGDGRNGGRVPTIGFASLTLLYQVPYSSTSLGQFTSLHALISRAAGRQRGVQDAGLTSDRRQCARRLLAAAISTAPTLAPAIVQVLLRVRPEEHSNHRCRYRPSSRYPQWSPWHWHSVVCGHSDSSHSHSRRLWLLFFREACPQTRANTQQPSTPAVGRRSP